MSLIEFFKKFQIKHPYKYVEPCPVCKSYVTGRYIKEPFTETDMEYIELESLKHGEIVRFAHRVPTKNAFCVDCDHRWVYTARTIYLTNEEMEEQIKLRNTEEAYLELKDELKEKDLISGKRKKSIF